MTKNKIPPSDLACAMSGDDCDLSQRLSAIAQQHRTPVVKSLRVYVFDCGFLKIADPARYHLKREEMATTDMSVACFLVAHPKGTLMWDVGVIPTASSAWMALR